jgi:hypothetical protein
VQKFIFRGQTVFHQRDHLAAKNEFLNTRPRPQWAYRLASASLAISSGFKARR